MTDSKTIYTTYINIISKEIISEENINNFELKSEMDYLKYIFYDSKYIDIVSIYDIYDNELKNIVKHICVYKIQNLFFLLMIPFNVIKNNVNKSSIFKLILQQNKIIFFDNEYFFLSKILKEYEFNQIKHNIKSKKIENNNSSYNFDEENIKIIMSQTNYNQEKAKDLYFKNNKSIQNVLREYLNSEKELNLNQNTVISTNQNIFKEIRHFLDKK